MDLTTTVGQGEFNPTHYIGEYAIPMLYLATWAKDPAMRQRFRAEALAHDLIAKLESIEQRLIAAATAGVTRHRAVG